MNYFKNETQKVMNNKDSFYYDYDCLNETIMEKYKIERTNDENINKYMNYIIGNPKYLNKEKVLEFIEKVSQISIEERLKNIK